jgi:hypothetical protein
VPIHFLTKKGFKNLQFSSQDIQEEHTNDFFGQTTKKK